MGAAIFRTFQCAEVSFITCAGNMAAPMAERKYFQIYVKKGLETVHTGIKSICLSDTVTDVLSSINYQFVSSPRLYVKAAKTAKESDDKISIELDCLFSVLSDFGCFVVWYILDDCNSKESNDQSVPEKNAFDVMMTAK